jgi:hypothetical protein
VSVNKYHPHVFVLPEDDANRQMANGFYQEVDWSRQRQMQVLPVGGGWNEVLDLLMSVHIGEVDHNPNRFLILLIDFDGREGRLDHAKAGIPDHLTERVFIIGVLTEPEALKPDLGAYEAIGLAMARDCREETYTTWGHPLLRHNDGELDRLRKHVRPILF